MESVNYHGINDVLELHHNGTLNGDGDFLCQIAHGYGITDTGDILNLVYTMKF